MGIGFKSNKRYQEPMQQHSVTASGTWTVPNGVYRVAILAVGGGGGSGQGYAAAPDNKRNYGTGGTGGCGGNAVSTIINVMPGDVFTIAIGNGGNGDTSGYQQTSNATDGGTTTVSYKGQAILSAVGGRHENRTSTGNGGNGGEGGSSGGNGGNGGNGITWYAVSFNGGGAGGIGTLEGYPSGSAGQGGNRGGGWSNSAGTNGTGGGAGGGNGSNSGIGRLRNGQRGGNGVVVFQSLIDVA